MVRATRNTLLQIKFAQNRCDVKDIKIDETENSLSLIVHNKTYTIAEKSDPVS